MDLVTKAQLNYEDRLAPKEQDIPRLASMVRLAVPGCFLHPRAVRSWTELLNMLGGSDVSFLPKKLTHLVYSVMQIDEQSIEDRLTRDSASWKNELNQAG